MAESVASGHSLEDTYGGRMPAIDAQAVPGASLRRPLEGNEDEAVARVAAIAIAFAFTPWIGAICSEPSEQSRQ